MVEKYRNKANLLGDGYALVEQASKLLEEELGAHAADTSVDWDRVVDEHGRPVYVITLRWPPDEAQARFTGDELKDPDKVDLGLSRLWRDLLRTRSSRLVREMKENWDTEE